MINKLLKQIPAEQLEKLKSTQVSHIVLGAMQSLNPMALLLFEKHYTLRKNYTDVGLQLKVGGEQELLYLQELLVPVQQFLEQPQMKGIIIPKLLGTLEELINVANTDLALLDFFGALLPEQELILSYLEQIQQLHSRQNVSLSPELVQSWNQVELVLTRAVETPMLDILKDFEKKESLETAPAISDKIFTVLLIPIYEYEYFLLLKQKIQDLEKEEKTGIEVVDKIFQEDLVEVAQVASPIFESSLIDGLARILMPYFTKETNEENLKALLRGENLQKRLFFHGPGNRFVEVFRQLHEKRKIYSSKKITCDWICQQFCFLNANTKEVTGFKAETVYDILSRRDNPVSRKRRIDISQILD